MGDTVPTMGWGWAPDRPIERLIILTKMKAGGFLTNPILLRWEGSMFVPPRQQ